MKKRLYLKLLIGYVIFGILGFILVSTFSSHYTYEYIEDTEVDRLYKEANMIASTYASNYFNEDITVDDLHDSLATLSTFFLQIKSFLHSLTSNLYPMPQTVEMLQAV